MYDSLMGHAQAGMPTIYRLRSLVVLPQIFKTTRSVDDRIQSRVSNVKKGTQLNYKLFVNYDTLSFVYFYHSSLWRYLEKVCKRVNSNCILRLCLDLPLNVTTSFHKYAWRIWSIALDKAYYASKANKITVVGFHQKWRAVCFSLKHTTWKSSSKSNATSVWSIRTYLQENQPWIWMTNNKNIYWLLIYNFITLVWKHNTNPSSRKLVWNACFVYNFITLESRGIAALQTFWHSEPWGIFLQYQQK